MESFFQPSDKPLEDEILALMSEAAHEYLNAKDEKRDKAFGAFTALWKVLELVPVSSEKQNEVVDKANGLFHKISDAKTSEILQTIDKVREKIQEFQKIPIRQNTQD